MSVGLYPATSAGPRRFRLPIAVAELIVKNGAISSHIGRGSQSWRPEFCNGSDRGDQNTNRALPEFRMSADRPASSGVYAPTPNTERLWRMWRFIAGHAFLYSLQDLARWLAPEAGLEHDASSSPLLLST